MDPRIGLRFLPSNNQIITHYLNKKIDNNNAKVPHIHEVDICSYEPSELSERYSRAGNPNDEVWYFYNPISRDSKMKRTTNAGFWKVTGEEQKIYDDQTGQVIGTKKILVYYTGRSSKTTKTPWVIHEFHSNKIIPSDKKAYVVCRLQKNSKSGN